MNNKLLDKFNDEFLKNHTFSDSEVEILRERHPNVVFDNIPVKWIIAIDEMLCRFRYINFSKITVSQRFGQFSVSFPLKEVTSKNAGNYLQIVELTRNKLYDLDKDVYLLFDKKEIDEEFSRFIFDENRII